MSDPDPLEVVRLAILHATQNEMSGHDTRRLISDALDRASERVDQKVYAVPSRVTGSYTVHLPKDPMTGKYIPTQRRATMSKHTPLVNPSKLLLDIRQGFIEDAGGSAEAFDWAVNGYAATQVDTERERCAQIADEQAERYSGIGGLAAEEIRRLAAVIRSTPPDLADSLA